MPNLQRNIGRTIARESYALAFAVPEVVAHRMVRMWLAGGTPSHRDRTEFHRMSAEKVAAFYESWNAMFLQMFLANVRFALSAMSSPWRATSQRRRDHGFAPYERAIAAVLGAGLAPVRRRAVANAKRLRRPTRYR